jgi:hypothetical protein
MLMPMLAPAPTRWASSSWCCGIARVPEASVSDPMEHPPQRLCFPFGGTAGEGRQRAYDGLVVVVLLRVQQSGCRRCSLGASTGRRCLTLKILKMG